jgi:hypothetical protein
MPWPKGVERPPQSGEFSMRLDVMVTREQQAKLQRLAAAKGLTVSALVRRLIERVDG